jgi:ribosome biogenesis GTPase
LVSSASLPSTTLLAFSLTATSNGAMRTAGDGKQEMSKMDNSLFGLESLGWSDFFMEGMGQYGSQCVPGRIAESSGDLYQIYSNGGLVTGQISGRFRHRAASRAELPAVGDWVALTRVAGEGKAQIHGLLPRKSTFTRKVAGRAATEQVVAANIDTVFLVTSLNQDLNPRRLERYLVMIWEGGANPAIILNKSDLCPDSTESVRQVGSVSMGVPIHTISVLQGEGLAALDSYLTRGKTVALLGSSGVGKSSLVNYLASAHLQDVQPVREGDDRGRHTTTRRQLFLLPSGALVLDTPGMREIQLWGGEEGVAAAFEDVETLAAECRYRDCSHQNEPGCAVRQALEGGLLDEERYSSYEKLVGEMRYAAIKTDKAAQAAQKKKWKKLTLEGWEKSRMKRR